MIIIIFLRMPTSVPYLRGYADSALVAYDLTLECQELLVVIDHAVKFASCELSANES